MNCTTLETRRESYEQILPKIGDRQQQCLDGLKIIGAATANELANYLYSMRLIEMPERNYVHPRLNELIKLGLIEIVGKKKDIKGRKCAIYAVKEGSEN